MQASSPRVVALYLGDRILEGGRLVARTRISAIFSQIGHSGYTASNTLWRVSPSFAEDQALITRDRALAASQDPDIKRLCGFLKPDKLPESV
jgi:hypothetical protein